MYTWRISQTSIVLILVLTLACGWISGPLETLAPPSPTDVPLVQIGYFNSIYLRYDPDEWETINEFQGQQLNNKGELIGSLRHRAIPGCFLHDNLGRGAPPTWELQETERTIGGLEYLVATWTDTVTQKPVLIVYQYPVGESGYGTRIELTIEQGVEQCIKSAEDALTLSSDLIAGSR
jgi:hypothetical protein